MHDYNILKLKLTNFFGARIIWNEDLDGHNEVGVFIPIDKNSLYKDKYNNVYAYAFMNRTSVANEEGWTHYLQLKAQKSLVDKMNELGYKMPYLGNVRPASYVIKSNVERKPEYVPIERKK